MMKISALFFPLPRVAVLVACAATLAGCGAMEAFDTPVQLITAPADQSQASEIIPIKQVLRPQDVLDVIFHLDTATKDAYRIQSGDQVDLQFLTADEFSGYRQVMPDGTIMLPYVGSIKVSGLTVVDAQQLIREKFTSLLKHPEIVFSVTRPWAQLENLRQSLQHPVSGMGREISVGADGRASFPLLGAIALQGMSIDELTQTLNERYAELPSQVRVDVLLKSTLANQIFVLGAVNQPGAYPIRRPVSVLEALSMARGTPIGARLDSVVIMRRQGNQVEARRYDVEKALDGDAEQFAYLQPDDLIYVPKTYLTRIGEVSRQIAETVLFNGVGYSFTYRVDHKESDNYP
ncbi:MAG: polysaccharide biosynthesis/export family protein [Zoogloeaceae bacterium]|jgi:polysaccharide export outer membrane protein|nr:polysaccharide biosynthesis/export family protein [Zoogloeaceae bacterium]